MIKTIPQLLADISTYITNKVGLVRKAEHGQVEADIVETLADMLNQKIPLSQKGAAGGVVPLNTSSKIDTGYLPSYVDDVLEYANLIYFPIEGEAGKIYVSLSNNNSYRWSGSQYIKISSPLELGEDSESAHRGDHGKSAYEHSIATGNPHGMSADEIGAQRVGDMNTIIQFDHTQTKYPSVNAVFFRIWKTEIGTAPVNDTIEMKRLTRIYMGVVNEANGTIAIALPEPVSEEPNDYILSFDIGGTLPVFTHPTGTIWMGFVPVFVINSHIELFYQKLEKSPGVYSIYAWASINAM